VPFWLHDEAGFTLIESIAASGILLIVSVAILATILATANWYAASKARTQATMVATQVLAMVQSRSYTDIKISSGGVWPASIPATMTMDTPEGSFAVETSITDSTDPATALVMRRIEVSVASATRQMTPISMVAYASGTDSNGNASVPSVPVRVVCVPGADVNNPTVSDSNPDPSYNHKGTPVQLRSISDLNVVAYTALTDENNIANFPAVAMGQYWLTVDPGYPVVHAIYFPVRIYPTAGGSSTSPILPVNEYNIAVSKPNASQAYQATLRIGAYRQSGWRFNGMVNGVWQFTTSTPYQPMEGLTVYAQPVLNTMDPQYFGGGTLTRYPDNTSMVYSAVVNGYGVACINIPWTLNPLEGQYWKVWATTTSRPASNPYSFSTSLPGGWTTVVSEPEKPLSGINTDIPQFQYVTGTATKK
jgi:type II secretory pathway pseudopilin PulG